jgi:hypothetical protein
MFLPNIKMLFYIRTGIISKLTHINKNIQNLLTFIIIRFIPFNRIQKESNLFPCYPVSFTKANTKNKRRTTHETKKNQQKTSLEKRDYFYAGNGTNEESKGGSFTDLRDTLLLY